MFHCFIKKLHEPNPKSTEALCEVLSLLFHTATNYKKNCFETGKTDKKIKDMLKWTKKIMEDHWIVLHFTPAFGDPREYSKEFTNHEKDVKVIRGMLSNLCVGFGVWLLWGNLDYTS